MKAILRAMGQVCSWNKTCENITGAKSAALCEHESSQGLGVRRPEPTNGNFKIVMKKYRMHMDDDDIMGEGTSSICRKGTCVDSSKIVAIKVYKRSSKDKVTMQKFVRQIEVLKELQTALVPPANKRLWSEELAAVKPSSIFMQLIDYSKDKRSGVPGVDPDDGIMYVITELGSYSLKDYFKLRRQQGKAMSKETVRNICKAIILATAGLHAKQLVHLDLKPENLMLFDGCLKLIDVDGCVKVGTTASIDDSSLSFSPCYCAPEWAAFLIDDADDPTIRIDPGLDVWSIGMTICELVLLDAMLKPMYASFLKHGRGQREAGFHFMEWLSSAKKMDLPRKLTGFDDEFTDLLSNFLLVCKPDSRRTLAEALSHPFLKDKGLNKSKTSPLTAPGDASNLKGDHGMPDMAPRHRRNRQEDRSDLKGGELHAGTLWKLNTGGDAQDLSQWLKRDMWITLNGTLCYYSQKQNKRLVLLDAHQIHNGAFSLFKSGVYQNAFKIETKPDHDDHADNESDIAIFACDKAADLNVWMQKLEQVKVIDIDTLKFSKNMCSDLRQFKLAIKNRRIKVEDNSGDLYAPVFRGRLWKVKAEGDRRKAADWFERDMWLAKNGSLVYWSKKEEKQLVYYTPGDLAGASLSKIPDNDSCRKFSFQVVLAAKDGIEFAPGEFAAESESMCDRWLGELERRGAQRAGAPSEINRRRSLW